MRASCPARSSSRPRPDERDTVPTPCRETPPRPLRPGCDRHANTQPRAAGVNAVNCLQNGNSVLAGRPLLTCNSAQTTRNADLQVFASLLTDSNRRPPPYHRATRREARAKEGSRGHESRARRIIARGRVTGRGRACPRWCSLSVPSRARRPIQPCRAEELRAELLHHRDTEQARLLRRLTRSPSRYGATTWPAMRCGDASERLAIHQKPAR
jgi:hypothetical protein